MLIMATKPNQSRRAQGQIRTLQNIQRNKSHELHVTANITAANSGAREQCRLRQTKRAKTQNKQTFLAEKHKRNKRAQRARVAMQQPITKEAYRQPWRRRARV